MELIGNVAEGIHPMRRSHFHRSYLGNPFLRDHKKHEYLHKYRDGWRHRGFPQGGSLSPLLSILPLILIEEMDSEVGCISYCDDGILYGNKARDMHKILQELFYREELGIEIHKDKSGWVKEDGK